MKYCPLCTEEMIVNYAMVSNTTVFIFYKCSNPKCKHTQTTQEQIYIQPK